MTPTVKINGVEYDIKPLRLIDFPLVELVTGLDSDAWAKRADRAEAKGINDIAVLLGLIAGAIAQAHPGWSREQVMDLIADIDPGGLEIKGADEDPPGVGVAAPESHLPAESNGFTTTPVDLPAVRV